MKQLLGITASKPRSKLVTMMTGGRHLPTHLEEQVKEGVWQMEVENTKFLGANWKKPLPGAWRVTERETTFLEAVKAKPEKVYYDAFESKLESSCRILWRYSVSG